MARQPINRLRNVYPDPADGRDRAYTPPVAVAPPATLPLRGVALPVLDQGGSAACTGFALATVIHHLLQRAGRSADAPVSPWMLYSMARRYDEFPGSSDRGSSLRGALRGWHRHGACSAALWPSDPMPPASFDQSRDWWGDAVRRPLGAYYRVDPRALSDLHAALAETGVLFASAICHAGWREGHGPRPRRGSDGQPAPWEIPLRRPRARDGGHAFAIVGYDDSGFLVQNSWGKAWGSRGLARLTYADWLAHAMDCWVLQLGVVTAEHRRVARTATPSPRAGDGGLSMDSRLSRHQLAPYVVGMQGDGRLAFAGGFRTSEDDVRTLTEDFLDAARRDWRVRPGQPLDIAIYAHGGLVSERDAGAAFARWWPALYDSRRMPVFLFWESDLASTIASRLGDVATLAQRPASGAFAQLGHWWDARVESLLAPAGSALWSEIKSRAWATSDGPESGVQTLFRCLAKSSVAREHRLRVHLVGHSAGSIVLAALIDRLAAREWAFESVTFLAPALSVATFEERVAPWIQARRVRRLRQFHLADAIEQRDGTARAALGYGRSLLYLVSEAFEGGRSTPILGLDRDFPARLRTHRNVGVHIAPGPASSATSHGAFDDDALTLASVIANMGR